MDFLSNGNTAPGEECSSGAAITAENENQLKHTLPPVPAPLLTLRALVFFLKEYPINFLGSKSDYFIS